MADFDTNKQLGFDILISLIEIWTPSDPKKPNSDPKGGKVMRIAEVEEIEIEESYKKLISSASVRFPRGTIIRETLTTWTEEDAKNFAKVTATTSSNGVIETTRTSTTAATTDTFKIGDRIKIYLGYTKDPAIAEMAKTNNTGQNIYNSDDQKNKYMDAFKSITIRSEGEEKTINPTDSKKYMSLMFDGLITKVSLDTPIELECENLASVLKTKTCPKVDLKKCTVKSFLGEDSQHKLLEGTGLKLHSSTAQIDFDLGHVKLSNDLTVADVLTEWAKYGLFCYVGDDNGEPAIQIGRAYFSEEPELDSLLRSSTTPQSPVDIHFDYHVANNGLSLTSTKKEFLAVEATGIDKDEKFIKLTALMNPDYDPTKADSESNPMFRYVNETKLSKKAIKAGKRYITESPNDKVNMKLYTKIAFVAKKIPITREELAAEAAKYLASYNMNGIEGNLTLFGDCRLHTCQKVRLIDKRYPGKQGLYFVDEVHTTFGTSGFRQRITLPYCIKREGNTEES